MPFKNCLPSFPYNLTIYKKIEIKNCLFKNFTSILFSSHVYKKHITLPA